MRSILPSRYAVLAVPLALAIAGCGTGGAPTATASASASQPASANPPTPTVRPTSTTQTQTSWGRIWDAIPASFPTYPTARPAQTGAGPFSATLAAASVTVESVTGWYKASLDRAGYRTIVEAPLEDGSRVLDSAGSPAGCRVQTRISKRGGDTFISILYGTGCRVG